MLLKNEIELLENKLLNTSSKKERLFYNFITGRIETDNIEISGGDLDKICYVVYSSVKTDISKEVERIAYSMPVKNIHYSNNIITLIAVCLKSDYAKNKYLKNYFNSHSLTERLLIKKVFPNENLQFIPNPISELDKFIDKIFFTPSITEAEKYLTKAFLEIQELIELLAFREAYIELLKIHPNTRNENQFNELKNEINNFIVTLKKRIDQFVLVIILLLSPIAVYFINEYYDSLNLEKISIIWVFVSPIFGLLLFLVKKILPKVFSFFEIFKDWIVKIIFLIIKTDYKKLSNLIRE